MSKMQRSKGQRGEREFFGLLSEQLGTCVRRNVDQARNGGADGIEVPGWAVEVKRQESGFQSAWWEQAQRQAEVAHCSPALAYRASRQPWRVRVLMRDAVEALSAWPCVEGFGAAWVEMDVPTFALIVRESVPIVQAA
jgi:Holliday junction resolvase